MLRKPLPAPSNFRYPSFKECLVKNEEAILRCDDGEVRFRLLDDGMARVRARLGRGNQKNYSEVCLEYAHPKKVSTDIKKAKVKLTSGDCSVVVDRRTGSFDFQFGGKSLIKSAALPFGVSGKKQIGLFDHAAGTVVYGLGEKTGGLDKSDEYYSFWNVDVVGEHTHTCTGDEFDPTYVSIPFFISRIDNRYFGVLLNNPGFTFCHAGLKSDPQKKFHVGDGARDKEEYVYTLGANEGELDLFLISGPRLSDVVRRYARLTGRHEMPPLWALGYHQCRWSYMSANELADVSAKLADARLPVGAMWMDIDYMDDFRVFTFDKKRFSKSARKKAFAAIRKRGTRLVTIVDPGIKAEPGYGVYDEARELDCLCKSEEGVEYTGTVWPGPTAFADYTQKKAQDFWAQKVAGFLAEGIDGIWNDMNDPSTGPIALDEMRFQDGKLPHSIYHNQYADLMARATRAGFEQKDPDTRPFILTRSAMTGSQRYTAVWTGDNFSYEVHLRMSIPMSINLALSGVSFNGPDVGGFCDNCPEALLRTWNLAGALFPFYRNHSATGTVAQEPYVHGESTLDLIRRCVYTRAKLLPYIYSEFYRHHRDGDALMRPLSYEFDGEEYERVGDQYLIGPSIMVAPFVDTTSPSRKVVLPPGCWFDMRAGKWLKGGRTITVNRDEKMMLYIRDGAIIPALAGEEFFPQPDMNTVEFHLFSKEVPAEGLYYTDDCETHAYKKGEYDLYELSAAPGEALIMTRKHAGYGKDEPECAVWYYGTAPREAKRAESPWPFGAVPARRGLV